MNSITKITALILLLVASAQAQTFSIEDAGEYDYESRTITSSGALSKYFAMKLQGSGDLIVRVSIGNQSATRTFTNLNYPRLTSPLFSYDLAEEVDISFRKGVVGKILLEILDGSENVTSSIQIQVNKRYGQRGCSRHKSSKLKTCRMVNLIDASRSLQSKLAKAFVKSLRRPIVLEP